MRGQDVILLLITIITIIITLRMSRVQSFFRVNEVRLVKQDREVTSWKAEGPFIGTQPPCV